MKPAESEDGIFERARDIVRRLREDGHEAWFAGGCVRDRLLGRPIADYDIATSARPGRIQKLFRRTIGVGKQFGVIVVLSGEHAFDVATFRADGAYGDGRRPDSVTFTDAVEDVRRRDFTINGLLMDPDDGRVVDHVGGVPDLERGVIRTIGDPDARFDEDRLRILRAIRFAARLDFRLDPGTEEAIARRAAHAAEPSPERILAELTRIVAEEGPGRGLALLRTTGVLAAVLPEVAAKSGVALPRRLATPDAGEALARTQALADGEDGRRREPAVGWALLLEDLGEGSPGANARAAEEVLRRLRASNALVAATGFLVGVRDRLLFATDVSAARRAVCAAEPRLALMAAFAAIERRRAEIPPDAGHREAPEVRELPAVLLRGPDLLRLGVPKGPALGRAMRVLRFAQLDGRVRDVAEAEDWIRSRAAR